jgi:hypothetical protein
LPNFNCCHRSYSRISKIFQNTENGKDKAKINASTMGFKSFMNENVGRRLSFLIEVWKMLKWLPPCSATTPHLEGLTALERSTVKRVKKAPHRYVQINRDINSIGNFLTSIPACQKTMHTGKKIIGTLTLSILESINILISLKIS